VVPFNGYVSGVSDAYDGTFLFVPPGVAIGQLSRIVGKYLDEHPGELHLLAAAIVLKALVKVYPPKPDELPMKTLEKDRPPDR